MKLGFERKVASWFVVASSVWLAMALGWYYSLLESNENVSWVEHTHMVLYKLRTVVGLLDEVLVGVDGYNLTGEDRYLEAYRRSLPAIDAELKALRQLTGDNRSQQARLDEIETAVAEGLYQIEGALDERRRGGLEASARRHLGESGEQLRRRFRGPIIEMEAEGRRSLDLRGKRAEASKWWMFALFLSGTATNILILVLVSRSIRVEIAHRSLTDQTLRQSQERFQGIFDTSTFGMALADPNWKWLEVNRSLCEILGYSKEELLGTDAQRLTYPEDLAADLIQARRLLDGEISSYKMEKRYVHKRGQLLWIALSASLVRDEAGRPLHFVKLMEDITPRKRAAEVLAERTRELESAQARLSVTAEFVSTLNQDGMLDVYRGALGCIARTTGVPLAVIYDARDGETPVPRCAVGPDHQPLDAAPFGGDGLPAAVIRDGESQAVFGPFEAAQLRIQFGLGEAGLHAVIGWPIVYLERCLGALVTAHMAPITEERRAFVTASLAQLAIRMNGFQVEQQRLKLLADLQAQSTDLQAQSIALAEAKQEAERASRAKSEFLANMSHELRTPMNSIMGFTERLITKLGDSLPERELKALFTVDRNAKHLLVLINDILDLAKIEAGKMELDRSRLDLATVVREVADQAAPLTDDRPIKMCLDLPEGPLMLEGDRVRLKQVVLNLLSNAIKYTKEGTVTIAARPGDDATLGRIVRLAVKDTGVGIRTEDLGRLFQQFTQLDGNSSRKTGGTGLGLAISMHYVRMHGGRIDVASEFGRGTEFTVLLPLREQSGADVPSPTKAAGLRPNGVRAQRVEAPTDAASDDRFAQDSRFGGVRILCVDDEPDVLSFLQLSFEDAGYQVMLASDHDTAIARARAVRPDLICLDLNMPGKDGFEVLKSLRTDADLIRIPVIVVSVTSEESRSLECGALRFLAKPVRADDLVAAVRDVLSGEIRTALVVDDDPDTARDFAESLARHGMHVRTAADGREGLICLAESPPTVIVLDLVMPSMDGFTFLEIVQRNPAWVRIPIVILTGKPLTLKEVEKLDRSRAVIMIKGRDDTERIVGAILKASRAMSCVPEGVVS